MVSEAADALRLVGVTRRFDRLTANDDISLAIARGEVHAILGENGAGKSTLMRIVSGIISADSGEIFIDGVRADIKSPLDAARYGIQMVHQHFALVGSLTVAENLHLAQSTSLLEPVSLRKVRGELDQLARNYGIALDPDALVDQLPVGSQQRVEIARAMLLRARILVLDEPTAVLTPREVADLFRLLRSLKSAGVSIIFISHKLTEVMALADRVTVLRGGRVVESLDTATATVERLSFAILGQSLERARQPSVRPSVIESRPALELTNVSTTKRRDRVMLQGINLAVRQGEIVGVAGVDGNGQSELVDVVVGMTRPATGTVHLGEETAKRRSAGFNLSHIPDDRARKGLVLSMSCLDNLLLRRREDRELFRFGFIRWGRARKFGSAILRRFMVRGSALEMPAGTLSGGNQQRVLLARELVENPRIIIAAQPTRGVDVAGAFFVHDTLRQYRDRGAGILLVSTELDELLAMSDRIVVMFRGQIMGELPADRADPLQLGAMMMGQAGGLQADRAAG
jgi:ABC-type uncharacterized transport system ATPase subunit